MKKYCFALLLTAVSLFASAQTWSEWFEQKKTKIKYLTEQVAALKAYSDYIGKGYSIAKKGLTSIADIKGGDATMHGDYFASLRSVNPVVKKYDKVKQIVSLQLSIIQICRKQRAALQMNSNLTSEESRYVSDVINNLLTGCTKTIGELAVLISNGSSRMKDDERISYIDALYADMQDQYAFIKSFGAETSVLRLQRVVEGRDIKISRGLFGVH